MKKRVLYYIPIEPLEERYTGEWYRWMPEAFRLAGFEVHVIDGIPLSDHVETGTFLDVNSTAHYKSVQLQTIGKIFHMGRVKDGDIFFIADLEFWGIELIRYLADLQNIQVFIYGFLHAGSYTKEDFMEKCSDYAKYFELGWLKMCDQVFVGSKYHKFAVYHRRIEPYCSKEEKNELLTKIRVTGNPMFKEAYQQVKEAPFDKRRQIIISNRFDWEKRPNLSLDFAYLIKKRYGDSVKIIITTSRPKFKSNKKWLIEYAKELEKDGVVEIYEGLTKNQYHTLLKESMIMISNTIEENFGYCIVEALYFNTYPLVKNDYSHPELVGYDERLLFDDEDEILEKIDTLLTADFPVSYKVNHYFKAMGEIIKSIKYNIGDKCEFR